MNSQSAAKDLSNFKLYDQSSTVSLNDVLIKLDKFDWETGDNIYYIYVLTEPNTLNIRYVGITKTPKTRYKEHLINYTKNKNNYRYRWIKSLKNKNLKPDMYILDTIKNNENIADIIETYYIQELSHYCKLTNYAKLKPQKGTYNNKYSPNKSKPVFVFDKSGILFESFNTVFEFIDKYNTTRNYVGIASKNKSLFQKKYFLSRTNFIDKSLLAKKGMGVNSGITCYEFNENNEIINTFDSMKHASLFYNFTKNLVKESIKRNNKCKDKIFSLNKDFNINTLVKTKGFGDHNKRKIIVYDLQNNLLGKFDSIRDCCKNFNIPIFSMYNLRNSIYKKYKLKIIEDMT